MAVMDGLATYEIWKTGITLFVMVIFLLCAIGFTIYNLSLNYKSIKGNITLNDDKLTETLTYTVNNVTYTKTIKPSTTTNNNKTTTSPTHSIGSCTVYYSSSDPNKYSVNVNPTTISGFVAGIACCLSIITFLTLLFLRANRNAAGVMGGISATQSVFSVFDR